MEVVINIPKQIYERIEDHTYTTRDVLAIADRIRKGKVIKDALIGSDKVIDKPNGHKSHDRRGDIMDETIEDHISEYESFKEAEDARRHEVGRPNQLLQREYQRGLKDAWECVRSIVGLGEPEEICGPAGFSNFVCECNAEEAIDRVKYYKQKLDQPYNKIKAGDIITFKYNTGQLAIVTRGVEHDHNKRNITYMFSDGSCGIGSVEDVIRTGHHLDSIDMILDHIREVTDKG